MTHEHDPFEQELSALRPAPPSGELAKRIDARLKADAVCGGGPLPGRAAATLSQGERGWRRAAAPFFIAVGAIAVAVLAAVVFWRGGERTPEAEMPLPSPAPSLAFDDALPSVWTYRTALASPAALDQLLDKHVPRRSAADDPEQTRGFGSLTIELNSRLGGL